MTQDWELWQHYLRLHSLIITSMVGQWNTLKEDKVLCPFKIMLIQT